MNTKLRKIEPGVYLVIDPSMEEDRLLTKLSAVLEEKIAAVQIWDNFTDRQAMRPLLQKIVTRCHARDVPVLINKQWELLCDTDLDGVHFDSIPDSLANIRKTIQRPFLAGLTCNNDLRDVAWAGKEQLDYISFCSVFPSSTSNSCDLVAFDSIREARKMVDIPIFLAGGIRPENMEKLQELAYDGVAVVSGIMSAASPADSVKEYKKKLNIRTACD